MGTHVCKRFSWYSKWLEAKKVNWCKTPLRVKFWQHTGQHKNYIKDHYGGCSINACKVKSIREITEGCSFPSFIFIGCPVIYYD